MCLQIDSVEQTLMEKKVASSPAWEEDEALFAGMEPYNDGVGL